MSNLCTPRRQAEGQSHCFLHSEGTQGFGRCCQCGSSEQTPGANMAEWRKAQEEKRLYKAIPNQETPTHSKELCNTQTCFCVCADCNGTCHPVWETSKS